MRLRAALACLLLATGGACSAARHDAAGSIPGDTASTTAAPAPSAPRRLVVLVGDSTTYGTPPPDAGLQSPFNPGATLETLLSTLEPADGPWHGARVVNLSVAASTTQHWVATPPPGCGELFRQFAVVAKACEARVSWIEALPLAAGGTPDAVIVDLGLNDRLITQDPAQTVDRLAQIERMLAPVPVLLYPPLAGRGARVRWVARVREEMVGRGLFSEKQYPVMLPTFDNLHLTAGGYAAKGALWVDRLQRLP